MAEGVDLSLIFDAGGTQTPFSVGTGATNGKTQQRIGAELTSLAAVAPAAGGVGPPSQTTDDGTHWFTLQKTFGPVSI